MPALPSSLSSSLSGLDAVPSLLSQSNGLL
jgi:hypothetical protein